MTEAARRRRPGPRGNGSSRTAEDGTLRTVDEVAGSFQGKRRRRIMTEILQATEAALTEHGYWDLTLEVVANRTERSRASLYYYFSSRQELISECLRAVAERWEEVLAGLALEQEWPASKRLREVMVAQILYLSETPEIASILTDSRHISEAWNEDIVTMRRKNDRRYRGIIESGLEAGEFQLVNPDVARVCLHGSLNAAAKALAGRAERRTRRAYAEDVADQILRMFVAGGV